MRLSGRLFLVLGLATGTALVTLFACGVDQEKHFPGLPDALPNNPGGAGFAAGLGAGGASSGSGSGSGISGAGGGFGGAGGGAIAGPAQSLCDVVAAANVAGSQCATCINATAAGACATQASACTGDATCVQAEGMCAACNPGTTFDACIVQCLDTSALYQQRVTCEFQNCNSLCGWSPPLACAITDGG